MKRILLMSPGLGLALSGCEVCNESCYLVDGLQRGVRLTEDDGPLAILEAPADGSVPEMFVSTLRIDTNTTTIGSFPLILNESGSFSLPEQWSNAPPTGSVRAPPADSCVDQYAAETVISISFPDTWPNEIQQRFPPQTLSYTAEDWPSGEAIPTVCIGDWCLEVYLR